MKIFIDKQMSKMKIARVFLCIVLFCLLMLFLFLSLHISKHRLRLQLCGEMCCHMGKRIFRTQPLEWAINFYLLVSTIVHTWHCTK